ncbi:MAG: methyltransferase domain-containing protein [Chitinophagales bacterium]
MENLDKAYWQNRYEIADIGWDIGHISTPLKAYFDQLTDKKIKILIPGCGNAYEAEYLFQQGFEEVYILDWSQKALDNFNSRVPSFPSEHLIQSDFFRHEGKYDLIVEQTFFCALNPEKRKAYVQQMKALLYEKGRLAGLMFGVHFPKSPPYGGDKTEYEELFSPAFHIKTMEKCYNSIAPRQGSELFVQFINK